RTVPVTVIAHGVGLTPQVPASFTPETTISGEKMGRKSAFVGMAGKVVMSTTLNRRRVTGLPVVLMNRRRISSVPNVELLPGLLVMSRTRFGSAVAGCEESISTAAIALVIIGADMFS